MGCSRFGPVSPSIVYRSMRQLEPSLSSPALHLPRTACQMHAKQYLADVRPSRSRAQLITQLFDRMFSLGVRGAAGETGAFGLAFSSTSAARTVKYGVEGSAQRYFLAISLDEQVRAPSSRAALIWPGQEAVSRSSSVVHVHRHGRSEKDRATQGRRGKPQCTRTR